MKSTYFEGDTLAQEIFKRSTWNGNSFSCWRMYIPQFSKKVISFGETKGKTEKYN